MKLFTKYNRINVLSTLIIFLLGCAAFAALLRYVVINQIDEDLKIERNEIATYVKQNGHLPGVIEVHDQYTTYKEIATPQISGNKIYTHEGYDAVEHEKELLRTIEFNFNVNSKWYLITVSKSLEGTDDLIQTIIAIAVGLILLILVTTFFINRIVLKKLWQPFYQTLQTMQEFKLSDKETLQFANTNIDEFNYLNAILNNAMSKASQDYKTLKEFTENAAHELQTPLAIIRSKLDNLIQDEHLTQAQSNTVAEAYGVLNRLNKLNQSLLLLSKIENRQFDAAEQIDLKERIDFKLKQFSELWQTRQVQVNTTLSESYMFINPDLADIMINNLLSNAIKYNIYKGTISIHLDKKCLSISNTGAAQVLDKKQIFMRFYKSNTNSESNGLGLAIVKQICEVSGCFIDYEFNVPDKHCFTITW